MTSKKSVRPNDRISVLRLRQSLKMSRSAHAYVRGSTVKFYEWLEEQKRGTLPEGPPVWICGDCHAGNLGPLADADGNIRVQIRDLDQTVIGNPSHDLIRLALSLATASRGSDLPGVTTSLVLEQMVAGYQASLEGHSISKRIAEPVREILKRSLKRRWRQLAEERIEDVRPEIPRGKRFWSLSKNAEREIYKTIGSE